MFDNLAAFLKGEADLSKDRSGNPSSEELQVATAVLLFAASAADSEVETIELKTIGGFLKRSFDISNDRVEELLSSTNLVINPDVIDNLVAYINESFNQDQRKQILIIAQDVVNADNEITLDEALVCDYLQNRLKIDD